MEEAGQPPRVLRFGAFEADLQSGELRKSGLRIRLPGQSFQILAMLLSRPGEVVTREQLRLTLWPNGTFVDFDHSLNTAIGRLRDALGDSAESPRFVETLAKRGYRFVAAVAPVPSPAIAVAAMSSSPNGTAVIDRRYSMRWLVALAAAALVAILTALIALNVAGMRRWLLGRAAAPLKIESIAVLPLANLSGDPAQEYFSDGMTEELITQLAKIGSLKVISRTSVMHYKGTSTTLPQIGRELKVDAVVEGSVLRSGDRVRITAQLIDARTDRHLWAQSYERDLRDVLVLQDEVAQDIASEIKITMTPQEQARLASRRPVDPEAHEAYLKGRYFWNRRTSDSLRSSAQYFEQAIERDPGYALAYAGLADSYNSLGTFEVLAPKDAFPKARTAAMRALQIDDTLGEAHTSLAWVKFRFDWDWSGAESEFKHALEFNPGYATAHHWYALYLAAIGRSNDAGVQARRAQELDPLSLVTNAGVGDIFYITRQYDPAIKQLRKTIELDSNFAFAHSVLGKAYRQKVMFEEALAEQQKAVTLCGGCQEYLAILGNTHAVYGNRGRALKILRQLNQPSPPRYVSPFDIALVYLGLGDKDEAFGWLGKAYNERSDSLVYLKVDPMFDSVRSDPRFQDFLRRMNFPS